MKIVKKNPAPIIAFFISVMSGSYILPLVLHNDPILPFRILGMVFISILLSITVCFFEWILGSILNIGSNLIRLTSVIIIFLLLLIMAIGASNPISIFNETMNGIFIVSSLFWEAYILKKDGPGILQLFFC